MNYYIWLRELQKYRNLIDHTRHILFEREAGRRIDYLLPTLNKLVDDCEFTNIKIAGNDVRPLASIESMLQNNLSAKYINTSIDAADLFWNETLNIVQKAASGKYVHTLQNFNDESDVHTQFGKMGAKVGIDYLILGLTVHAFDANPTMLASMVAWLKANK